MLKALIRFSLRYSSLVVLASLLLSGYAAYRLPQMSVDVFPELNAPTVVVMAEAGGLAADEVEQYVTFPIESAVNGMTGVRLELGLVKKQLQKLTGGLKGKVVGHGFDKL